MAKHKHLWDTYRFSGFYPEHTLSGIFGDPKGRVIGLVRRGKKVSVEPVGLSNAPSTIGRSEGFETCPVATPGSTWMWKSAGFSVAGARR